MRIAPGREFVMSALSSQQRPRAPDAPSEKWTAVVVLSVSVVRVTFPAWTGGKIGLERRIDYSERIFHQRCSRLADSIAHQFKESAVDYFRDRELIRDTRRTIVNAHNFALETLGSVGVADIGRIDPHVVALDPRKQKALIGDRPVFDVRFEKVGVLFQKLRT